MGGRIKTRLVAHLMRFLQPKTFRYYGNIFLQSKSNLKIFDFKYKYFQRVIDSFGDRNIDEITRLDIKQYLISLNQSYA